MSTFDLSVIDLYYNSLIAYGSVAKAAKDLGISKSDITTEIRKFAKRINQLLKANPEYRAVVKIGRFEEFPTCAMYSCSRELWPQIKSAIEHFNRFNSITPHNLVKNNKSELSDAERFNLKCQYLLEYAEGKTLLDLSKKYDLSRERIRQHNATTMRKINRLTSTIPELTQLAAAEGKERGLSSGPELRPHASYLKKVIEYLQKTYVHKQQRS